MIKNILILAILICTNTCIYSQTNSTARARVFATIIQAKDTTAYYESLRALPKTETNNVVSVESTIVPNIYISANDSIRLMKKYIRKKKRLW